jgi:excisionase family DNA binding protein
MARNSARDIASENSSNARWRGRHEGIATIPEQPPSGSLLNAHEVAQLLGVSAEYVWQLSREGRIPTITLGRARRYRRESVLGWLQEIESPRSSAK